jgi:hypothetical protein
MLLALFLAPSAFSINPPMPAFIWDGTEGLLQSSTEITDSFSTSSLVDFVKYSAGSVSEAPEPFKSFVIRAQLPEVLFVFVQPELHTSQVSAFGAAYKRNSDGGSFSNLKTFIETTPSLTIPYVYQVGDESLIEELKKVENVHFVDAENAPAYLHGRQSLFRDSKADVVVIQFSSLEANQNLQQKLRRDDSLMEQIIRKAQTHAGKYIAVYTSNSPTLTTHEATTFAKSQMLLSVKTLKASDYSNSTSSDALYMTPGILSGLLISFLLIFISSCGITALFALKTPSTFEGEGGYLAGK